MASKANLQRSPAELSAVFTAEREFIESFDEVACLTLNLSLKIAGDVDQLPSEISEAARKAYCNPNAERKLYLCIGYDPFDELTRSLSKMRRKMDRLDIIGQLEVDRPVDLIVRTGGAVTLSDFLPLQSSYARIIFLDRLFNDTSTEEFMICVREHEEAELLYGE